MEAVGLGVGIVGLLGLFESCIGAFDRVDAYREYGTTSRRLQTRFENQRHLLEQCKARAQVEQHGLEGKLATSTLEESRQQRVEETLRLLRDFLTAQGKGRVASPTVGKVSRFTKLRYAVRDKQRLTNDVDWFASMVQDLSNLINSGANSLSNHPSIPGPGDPSPVSVEALKTWLGSVSSRSVQDQSFACRTPGTCEWIFEREGYKRWLDPGSAANTFWLHAPPGFGKTVTASAICEHISHVRASRLVCYFCSASNDRLRLSSNILRSLVTQAVLSTSAMLTLAEKARLNSDSQLASETDLWNILSTCMTTDNGMIVLLDGFDECYRFESDLHRRNGIDRGSFLRRLHTSVKNTKSRLIVVSRDEVDIRQAISSPIHGSSNSDLIEYAITRDDVSSDIALLSTQQVQDKLSDVPGGLQTEIISGLTKNSDGMFLWVRLQSVKLETMSRTADLRAQIANTPSDLENQYNTSWDRIQSENTDERDIIMTLLRWISFSTRPLTVSETIEAGAIGMEGTRCRLIGDRLPDSALTVNYIHKHLVHRCRPFLNLHFIGEGRSSIDCGNATVQLAHFSMKEFLAAKLKDPSPLTVPSSPDDILAAHCVAYLASGLAWSDPPPFGQATAAQVSNGRPLLTYAAANWMKHFNTHASTGTHANVLVDQFFLSTNEYWIRWRDLYEEILEKEEPALLAENLPYAQVCPGDRVYYAAFLGLLGVLRELTQGQAHDLNAVCGRYGTPLQAACARAHQEVAKHLLSQGAGVNVRAGLRGSALNAAAASGDEILVSILLTNGADCTITDDYGRHALYTAAMNSPQRVIERLIKAGAPLNQANRHGRTPVSVAAAKKDDACVLEILLNAGADPNLANGDASPPIQLACLSGTLRAVELLIASGADVNAIDTRQQTPLYMAVYRDDGHGVEIMQTLITAGADPNVVTNDSTLPIHLACLSGTPRAVELLVAAGADVDAIDNHQQTPLYMAVSRDDDQGVAIVQSMIAAGADVTKPTVGGQAPIHLAAQLGKMKLVEILVQCGSPVNSRDDYMVTPLFYAAQHGSLQVIEYLHKHGADLSLSGNYGGSSPLIEAVDEGHIAVVGWLLDHGVDPNAIVHSSSALCLASWNGNVEIAKLLTERGASNTACSAENYSPLRYCLSAGHIELAKYFWKTKRKWFDEDNAVDPLQVTAVKSGKRDVMQLLEGLGYPLSAKWKEKRWALLHIATQYNHAETVQYLLSRGADINAKTSESLTPFIIACERGHTALAQLLFRAGAKETAHEDKGLTALSRACELDEIETVRGLIAAGVNVMVRNKDGSRPLHRAAMFGRLEVVKMLLQAGAEKEAPDWEGKTAARVARDSSKMEVYKLLEDG